MTGCPTTLLDATQEILVKVLTRLSTFNGEAAFTTWVHRVAVNHLLDRKRSAVERFELTFGAFADDLHDGLAPVAPNAGPELDLLAREVKHGCTLALLTCLDREPRVAYVLGEVFGVSSTEGAWICETTASRVPQAPVPGAGRGADVRRRALRARRPRSTPGAIAASGCQRQLPLGRIDPADAEHAIRRRRRRCGRRDGGALRRRRAATERARRRRTRRRSPPTSAH